MYINIYEILRPIGVEITNNGLHFVVFLPELFYVLGIFPENIDDDFDCLITARPCNI